MIYSEGATSSEIEKVAIAYSAINRLNDERQRFGKTMSQIVRHPAYSYFSPKRVEKQIKNPCNMEVFNECYEIAEGVLTGRYPDPTNGATHYHTTQVNPLWRKDRDMDKIGRLVSFEGKKSDHIFYNNSN